MPAVADIIKGECENQQDIWDGCTIKPPMFSKVSVLGVRALSVHCDKVVSVYAVGIPTLRTFFVQADHDELVSSATGQVG
jgi:hypothetical protein